MDRTLKKLHNLSMRKRRIRSKIKGSATRPRLSIKISNLHINAQIIDDEKAKTLASATTVGKNLKGTMSEKAKALGEEIAKNAKKAGIKTVVFDRNGRKYHGRLKELADAARAGGLEF
jgi:large subunit ribosomal protein L18